jgi:hypothetical protein
MLFIPPIGLKLFICGVKLLEEGLKLLLGLSLLARELPPSFGAGAVTPPGVNPAELMSKVLLLLYLSLDFGLVVESLLVDLSY